MNVDLTLKYNLKKEKLNLSKNLANLIEFEVADAKHLGWEQSLKV